jgi:hypothetical protein
MRCMGCGGEMILMNVVPDDTMAVPGFEHHSFMCSECQDMEQRLVFTKYGREEAPEGMPIHAAPPPSRLDRRWRIHKLRLRVCLAACSPLLVTERQAGICLPQRKLRVERWYANDLIQTDHLARLRSKGATLAQPCPYLRLARREYKIGSSEEQAGSKASGFISQLVLCATA